jgi:hypothetical protein
MNSIRVIRVRVGGTNPPTPLLRVDTLSAGVGLVVNQELSALTSVEDYAGPVAGCCSTSSVKPAFEAVRCSPLPGGR